MADTVADLEGLQAERTPDENLFMTSLQWRLAVVAELVLGTILGSLFLGTHSLFLDESVSSTLATAPWHQFANVVSHREANMALYYLLLRGWVVFGHSEIALRSLSVILAVGALCLLLIVPLGPYASADWARPVGALLNEGNTLAYQLAMTSLAVGNVFLWSLAFRVRLIPRWLSVWGVVGYGMFLFGAIAEIFGSHIGLMCTIAGGLFEVFLGFWLIFKGFEPEPSQAPATRAIL